MQDIRSILVVLDPLADEQPALRRACLIARSTGSELHLLDSGIQPGEQLEALADELRRDGYTVTTRRQFSLLDHVQVIEAQQAEGCDLVIKQHYPLNPLARLLLTPDDWKLLRLCPCPLLLVRGRESCQGHPVLAAVDLECTDAEHRALHERITREAFELARLVHGPLHVLSVHPASPLSHSDPAFALGGAVLAHHHQACIEFCEEFGVPPQQLHVTEGAPDLLIPRMAEQLDAGITVIGSVARIGLDAALIGNTAESVLEAVEHDVLVLKPEAVEQRLARQPPR